MKEFIEYFIHLRASEKRYLEDEKQIINKICMVPNAFDLKHPQTVQNVMVNQTLRQPL